MAAQYTPIWAHAPINATHWAPDDGDYTSAWYIPVASVRSDEDGIPIPRAHCYVDMGMDVSKLSIPIGEDRYTSDRPHDQLIPRPASSEKNDVDNW